MLDIYAGDAGRAAMRLTLEPATYPAWPSAITPYRAASR
jgi:hypothetical protein